MTILSFLSVIFRLIGFGQWADFLYEKHKEKVARNVENNVRSLSDDELTKRVRDEITRH